jgi:putative heme transporter
MMSVVGLFVVAAVAVGARWRHGERKNRLAEGFRLMWAQCAHVLRRGWRGLAVGGIGYPLLQMLLLWSCLVALQVNVSIGAVVAAYAIERLLTLVPLTPGGVGVVETSATAVLVGFGADPAGALAGVVLFRVFSYLIEIPLGAVVAAAWFARRHRNAAVAMA